MFIACAFILMLTVASVYSEEDTLQAAESRCKYSFGSSFHAIYEFV